MASRLSNKLGCDWLSVGFKNAFHWFSWSCFDGVLPGNRSVACVREALSKVTMTTMVDGGDVPPSRTDGGEEGGEEGEAEEGEGEAGGRHGLTEAQRQVLDRCLLALKHAKNDSHMLAALLVITRLCPASQLDKPTLHHIFEAVGFNLPARLLVTAVQGGDGSGLPSHELLSLGTALLAALSTDPDMVAHPQLLATIPLLLGVVANEPVLNQQKREARQQNQTGHGPECEVQSGDISDSGGLSDPAVKSEGDGDDDRPSESPETPSALDEAMAADCYQVLTAVCALPRGPDQLLSRGAVPSLCQAVEQNRTFSQQKGLDLLGGLLTSKTKHRAWSKHPAELLALLLRLSTEFCQSTDQARVGMCARLVQFLPPAGQALESEELRGAVSRMWGALRPLLQAKLTAAHIGSILVLSACLLDMYGWGPVGPPKFCCLLVNRACVEVRMGLEEPPGSHLSPGLQHTLTGCYRILEAAIEQACCAGDAPPAPHTPLSALSLQQSRQVLEVLEEAFSAVMYHLQQVDPSRYGDPFTFASFRSLCSWLAEETSCLKQEVMGLLPFLIGYTRCHLRGGSSEQGLSDWMAEASVSEKGEAWTGAEALRYLLPALCHLSAEEGPRKVLLTLDTPALLGDFLSQSWASLKGKSGAAACRDPSMETACSTLLNFTVTEPERVRKDPCFRALEAHLSDALPGLVNKPGLLVLAAYYCTLGLMIGRLKSSPSGSMEAGQRRFLSVALRFLRGALDSGGPGSARVSARWEESWDEAAELWRLCVQALGGCVRAQPGIGGLVREEGWLKHTLAMLAESSQLPDRLSEEALEEALGALAEQCPACRREIRDAMTRRTGGALSRMRSLKKSLEGK